MFLTIAQIRSEKIDVSECPNRRTLMTPDIEFAVVRIKKVYGSTVISSKNRAVVSMVGGMGPDGLHKMKAARLSNRCRGIYFWSEIKAACGIYVSLNDMVLRIYSEDVSFSDGQRPVPLASYYLSVNDKESDDLNISIKFNDGIPFIRCINRDGTLCRQVNIDEENEEEHDEYAELHRAALSRGQP